MDFTNINKKEEQIKDAHISEKEIKVVEKIDMYLEIIFKVNNFFKKVSINEIKISEN